MSRSSLPGLKRIVKPGGIWTSSVGRFGVRPMAPFPILSGLGGPALRRSGHVAQLLAWLEADREAGRNLDFLGRAFRVAADAPLSGFDEQHAEAAQFDPLAAR